MDMKDLANLVAKSAPLLGSVLGGPAGAAIGALLAAKFGGDTTKPEQLVSQILGDPQAPIKLMQIQTSHEAELQRMLMIMAENELKYEAARQEAEIKDRNNARQREVELAKAGKIERTPAILAYLLTLGMFLVLSYLFFYPVSTNNQNIIVAIVSALTTVWIAAMAYYHGSSSGSRHKDTLLMQGGYSKPHTPEEAALKK